MALLTISQEVWVRPYSCRLPIYMPAERRMASISGSLRMLSAPYLEEDGTIDLRKTNDTLARKQQISPLRVAPGDFVTPPPPSPTSPSLAVPMQDTHLRCKWCKCRGKGEKDRE